MRRGREPRLHRQRGASPPAACPRDAVGDGGRGDAELLRGAGEALLAGGGLEEAQVFERGKEQHAKNLQRRARKIRIREKPLPTGCVRSSFRVPGRAAVGTVGFGNRAVPPRRDRPGPLDRGCCAPPYPDSAGRDDRAQAPHSTSATPGGRVQIGRAQANLPVEPQTLDGNLGRALRRVSAMPLAAPPDSLLALLAISRRYNHLGDFPMVDVPVLVLSPLRAWRRWSSSSSHG